MNNAAKTLKAEFHVFVNLLGGGQDRRGVFDCGVIGAAEAADAEGRAAIQVAKDAAFAEADRLASQYADDERFLRSYVETWLLADGVRVEKAVIYVRESPLAKTRFAAFIGPKGMRLLQSLPSKN